MNDFDQALARCLGEAASKCGGVDRAMIAACYYEAMKSSARSESLQISEKWIDFLADRLNDVELAGRNSEQATSQIFKRIAKT